ncbi:MAG: dockerin type I repeat-containing protein, partial [Clostridia bacterium]|nr:dockerin type I repeat-containing protein [Clostridia bacterium]
MAAAEKILPLFLSLVLVFGAAGAGKTAGADISARDADVGELSAEETTAEGLTGEEPYAAKLDDLCDVDGDGEVSAADARSALRFSLALESPDDRAFSAADTDFSGDITASDARSILRISLRLDSRAELFAGFDGFSVEQGPRGTHSFVFSADGKSFSFSEPCAEQVDSLVPASCFSEGSRVISCPVCGRTRTEPLPRTAHSFTNYVSDGNATLYADGTKTAVCDAPGCGATDTVPDPGSR